MVLAVAGIVYQQVTNQVSVPLLVVYMAVGGLPGVTTVIRLLRALPSDLSLSSPPVPPSSSTGPGSSGTPQESGGDHG